MRILYALSENLNRDSGGIVHFLAVARGLKEMGHDVTITGPRYSLRMRRFPEFRSIFLPVPGRSMVTFFIYQVALALLFPFIYLRSRPDVLLCRGGTGVEFLFFLVARAFGVRVVLEVNGLSWEELSSRGFPSALVSVIKKLAIWQARMSDRIISVTPAIGKELAIVSGVPLERVFPIQNGADPLERDEKARRELRKTLGVSEKDFVVGFVGKFCTWHGIDELVRSANCLPKEMRRNVKYLLVGDGEKKMDADCIVNELDLGSIVIMPGMVRHEEVPSYMAAFDAGIFVTTDATKTKYGTSSLKFWEYLAAGLPVLVGDDSNMTPIVEAENMGLVIGDVSPEGIADIVCKSWNMRNNLSRTGTNNQRLIKDKYSWLHVAKRVAYVLGDQHGIAVGSIGDLSEPLSQTEKCQTRKVMMINQHFYPHGGPGAHRMAKMAKYLPELGWDPVVVCVDATPENSFAYYDSGLSGRDTCEMIRVPLSIPPKRSLWGILYRILLYVCPHLLPNGPYAKMKKAAETRLQKGDIDIMLASSPVHFSLVIANHLSKKYGVPWVADMRDLPGECSDGKNIFSELRWLMRMQMATCRSAAALVSVSEPLGEELRRWHPGKCVRIVYNGFEPENYDRGVVPDNERFSMVYCGRIAGGTTPRLLLDALDNIISHDSSLLKGYRLCFYGADERLLEKLVDDRPCAPHVEINGRVSFDESVDAQQKAQALLFLAYPHAEGIMSSKLFEYLGAGRPVLSVPGDGGVTDTVLSETGGGCIGHSQQEIETILTEWLSQWRDSGRLEYHGQSDKIEAYTRKQQTAVMVGLFNQVYSTYNG